MSNEQTKYVGFTEPETGVFLPYDLPSLQAVIDSLRNETSVFAGEMLSELEHRIGETYRLEESKRRAEEADRQQRIAEQKQRLDD